MSIIRQPDAASPSMAALAKAGDEWRLSRPTTASDLPATCCKYVPKAWPTCRAASSVSGASAPDARPRMSYFLKSLESMFAIGLPHAIFSPHATSITNQLPALSLRDRNWHFFLGSDSAEP